MPAVQACFLATMLIQVIGYFIIAGSLIVLVVAVALAHFDKTPREFA